MLLQHFSQGTTHPFGHRKDPVAKMEEPVPKEHITSPSFPATPIPTATGASASTATPIPTSFVTQAELDQAMDLWNDDETELSKDFLDAQYTHLKEDWLTFARHLQTIPSKLMGTYFQKDLQLPRDWVWPVNTKAKTMENYYFTLMALHLWDDDLQFPPLTHKNQTYPIPVIRHPPPEEDQQQEHPDQDLSPKGKNTATLSLSTAQQAAQQAHQAALDKIRHPSANAALTQPKPASLHTHRQLLGQMNQFFPTNIASPISATNTLAAQGSTLIPGTYVQLPSGILWDPAQDTYRSKSGIQLTPQKFTYQPQDDKDYTWTPDIQLTTIRPVNRSLSTAQYENFCHHQRHLQHLHLGMEWPANTEIPIHYPPNSPMPRGIAGVEFSCLLHELELKTFLVADRYSGPSRVSAIDQANQFRVDLAKSWHLPLQKLFTATDAHLQLKAHSAKILTSQKFATQPLDKNTTRAMQTLQQPPSTQRYPNTSPQGQQTRARPQAAYTPQQHPATPSTSSPIITPASSSTGNTLPSHTRTPPNQNYRGKNFDSHIKPIPHQGEDRGGWR